MENPTAPHSGIYINNAGLVLLWPFLSRLFDLLSLIDNNGFVDEAAAFKAIVLLQYAATGNEGIDGVDTTLNKLLCGVKAETTIPVIALTETEKNTVNQMLHAVTQHWDKLKNTSIDGLRDTFLHRVGKLERKEETWQLTVEQKGFDVLLYTIPWSFSTIKLTWMPEILQVTWR
jgi:hypothetical protein